MTRIAQPRSHTQPRGAHGEQLGALYADRDGWARKAILNVAASGKFSSDRTIAEYAAGIWNAKPCVVT